MAWMLTDEPFVLLKGLELTNETALGDVLEDDLDPAPGVDLHEGETTSVETIAVVAAVEVEVTDPDHIELNSLLGLITSLPDAIGPS